MLKHKKKAVAHLSAVDPILAQLIARVEIPKRTLRPDYFISLCRSIIGQQLSVAAAATIYARTQALFTSQKNGMTPAAILKMPAPKLRKAGLSAAKVLYLKNLARFAIKNKDKFAGLDKMGDAEIIDFLVQIKGIGRWTAEMFLMFTLGREDVFSHGDLGLRNAVQKYYKLRGKPSVKTLEKIVSKWAPYRSHASLYLWSALGADAKAKKALSAKERSSVKKNAKNKTE